MRNPIMVLPEAMRRIQALHAAVETGGVAPTTLGLVNLRASQINGCVVCVAMGEQHRRGTGRATSARSARDVARGAPLHRRRARRPDARRVRHPDGPVPDAVWDEAARHYDERGLAALLVEIALTRVWSIVAAMERRGVRRLVYLSFLGVREGRAQLSTLGRWIVAPLRMRNVVADHEAKERIIRASSLDWVIVRPPRLTTGPGRGTYRSGMAIRATSIVPRISRADVAHFMVRQLDDDTFLRQAPAVMW